MKSGMLGLRAMLSLGLATLLSGAVYADWQSVSIGGGSMKRVLMDVDGDGCVDSLSVNYWYRNPGTEAGAWQPVATGWNREIRRDGRQVGHPNIASFVDGQRVGDVNGDGRPDMVIGTVGWDAAVGVPVGMRDSIYVAINPGTQGNWSFYYIGTLSPATEDGAECIEVGDMNNDGRPDILVGGECHQVRLYVNPGSMKDSWPCRTVYTNSLNDVEGLALADFNRDNYLDIAATTCASLGFTGGTIVLLNPGNDTCNWTHCTVDSGNYSCVETIAVGDMDGDGCADVVLANRRPFAASLLYWYRNNGGGTSWIRHTVDTLSTQHLAGRLPAVADVDLDGRLDIICCRPESAASFWYKNHGASWVKAQITTGALEYYATGDADNDGDVDIICAGRWYKNPAGAR